MKRMFVLPAIVVVILLTWCSAAAIYANAARQNIQAQKAQQARHNIKSQPTSEPTTPLSIIDKPVTIPIALKGSIISQGNDKRHEIALTFDDGPYPYYTAQILAILQRYQVHATFFCVGKNVQNYPMLVQQEYAAGNAVENHTWDHADLTRLSRLGIQREVNNTSSIIQNTIGVAPILLRPPYGAINISVRAQIVQLHLVPVLWSVDTKDWQRPGTAAIINTALTRSTNGSIILMHDGGGNRAQTVAALPGIIEALRLRGYDFVTVPQLIGEKSGNDS